VRSPVSATFQSPSEFLKFAVMIINPCHVSIKGVINYEVTVPLLKASEEEV